MLGTSVAYNVIVVTGSILSGNCMQEYKLYLSPKAMPTADIDKQHPYMTDEYPAMYPVD